MLQIAVCDDQEAELGQVKALLAEYARLRPEAGFELRAFHSGGELLDEVKARGGFMIYLLDVMMPEPDGLAVGAAIREDDPDAVIIYLTSSPDYAVDSYGVQATGYLLKPVERGAFFAQLDRVMERLRRERSQVVAVRTRDRVSLVRISDIRYAEGTNHTVNFYLAGGRSASSPKRGPFEEAAAPLLADGRFLRAGSSYIVNMLYIDRMEQGFIYMQEGGKILVPRLRRGEVREKFLEFSLKRGLDL